MHCIDQALEGAQNLLLEMCSKFQVLEKWNALLEAQKRKGHKGKVQNLSNKELWVALKEEGICAYGRKYSATHCLWIPTQIFPLCKNPEINLYSAECWLSPLAIKDGVKIFKFISKQDHALMAHKDVGDAVSPLKSCSCLLLNLNAFILVLAQKYGWRCFWASCEYLPAYLQSLWRTILLGSTAQPYGKVYKICPLPFPASRQPEPCRLPEDGPSCSCACFPLCFQWLISNSLLTGSLCCFLQEVISWHRC